MGFSYSRPRIWVYAAAAATTALAISGCTGTDNTEPAAPTQSTTTAPTTTTALATTSAAPVTEPDVDPSAANSDVVEVWQEFITLGADRSDAERVAELSDDATAIEADKQFFDPRLVKSFYTQVTVADTTATIEDCSLFALPLSEFPYVPLTGTAELVDDQWQITSLDVSFDPCIPGDVATDVLAAYDAYWDAFEIYGNPPDLDSPLIEQVTTGRHLERQKETLQTQIEQNIGWQGRSVTNPSFFSYDLNGEIVLEDCVVVTEEAGFYDLDTGERTANNRPIEPGQKNDTAIRLKPVDGTWKVESTGVDRDVDCEPTSVETGIPVLGPFTQP